MFSKENILNAINQVEPQKKREQRNSNRVLQKWPRMNGRSFSTKNKICGED